MSFKFSNFALCSIPIRDNMGIEYCTVEHAYQASKSNLREERLAIARVTTPGKAKRMGKNITLGPNWEEIKLKLMKFFLSQKFECPEHYHVLIGSKGHIVEDNAWHDNFWGVCHCTQCPGTGQNQLGILLMELRGKLRQEEYKCL